MVASTDSRTLGHRDYRAVGGALPSHPTVVLIDHNTASAAEILTSALADHHVATVVGTRSYGKGTFQEVIHLPAGGALDMTVGKYFTADGTSLLGTGIKPDVHAADNPNTLSSLIIFPESKDDRAERVARQAVQDEPSPLPDSSSEAPVSTLQ